MASHCIVCSEFYSNGSMRIFEFFDPTSATQLLNFRHFLERDHWGVCRSGSCERADSNGNCEPCTHGSLSRTRMTTKTGPKPDAGSCHTKQLRPGSCIPYRALRLLIHSTACTITFQSYHYSSAPFLLHSRKKKKTISPLYFVHCKVPRFDQLNSVIRKTISSVNHAPNRTYNKGPSCPPRRNGSLQLRIRPEFYR